MKEFHETSEPRRASTLTPCKIRFATYTLKYNHVAWLTIKRLTEHYRRATIEAPG